jgi:hypothetical protein
MISDVKMTAGFICLRIDSRVGSYELGNKFKFSIKGRISPD